MVKIPKKWVGKKNETDPSKKQQHQDRKTKQEVLHKIEDHEWDQQVKEYIVDANPAI